MRSKAYILGVILRQLVINQFTRTNGGPKNGNKVTTH